MSKTNRLKYVIIIISIVLTLTGVVILGLLQNNNNLEENTVIEVNGETSKTLKAEIKGLYPGKTEEYTILLKGDSTEEYSITLNFFDDNGGELKKYIVVRIETNNNSIEKSLEELLEGELISLGQGVTEITILYTMPIDVGDEAQGASIVFYVELNAKMMNNE